MRRFYEDLMRQMETELRRSDETMRRFVQAVNPGARFWEPEVDVYETPDSLQIRAELAGVHPEDLQVELTADGQSLVIKGHRRDPLVEAGLKARFHQMEVLFGAFERVVPLPARPEVDREHVQATYRDGFLLVVLPKAPERQPAPTISVRVTGE